MAQRLEASGLTIYTGCAGARFAALGCPENTSLARHPEESMACWVTQIVRDGLRASTANNGPG
jgi:hypothetical protein